MPAGLTSRWGWYWVRGFPDPGRAPKCKTQNSGLCSKEEKPRDPINEPSRCNTQEGLLSAAQPGDPDLLGGRAHRIWGSFRGHPCGSDGKESAFNAGNLGSIPGLERSLGGGNGYPLQYCGLENSMDRGVWQATVHGVTKSRTQLSDFHFWQFRG